MTRDEWRQRLVDAELPEDLVDDLLKSMKDEDFARMKDMPLKQVLDLLREGTVESEDAATSKDTEEAQQDDTATEDDTEESSEQADEDQLVHSFEALGEYVSTVVKDTLKDFTLEVEVLELSEIKADIAELKEGVESFKEISKIMKDMLESDEQRLREIVRDMSPASRTRLHRSLDDTQIVERVVKRLKEKEKAVQQVGFQPSSPDGFQPVWRDAQGVEYASGADMAAGNPIAD